ncbi:MAG: type transport system ATP-binding protein [Actinomycetota bacterium]|nr:type transport system ATP-binding protein [Actinomycetota bacterium]
MSQSLCLEGITFSYGRRSARVVDGLTWLVPPGRTVLLGPNGAGKSTILSLAADSLQPAAGSRRLGNLDPSTRRGRQEYRRRVGWMPQTISAMSGFTVREQVAYHGWLKGMSRREAWRTAVPALRAVGLEELQDRSAAKLSGGQLRRVGLAQAFVHRPQIVLLDEPTVGLDPMQRARFREILRGVGQECSIVVSTHQIDDLGDLFHQVAVVDRGRIILQDTTEGFLSLGGAVPGANAAEVAYATALPRREM